MLNSILSGTATSSVFSMQEFLLCLAASAIFGCVIALIHNYKNSTTKNFTMTLVLLPIIVQTVISIVNGNLGTGVAVAGAFSLVRFRSLPGTSREISAIFLAMAVGLATGMGYIGVSAVLVLAVGLVSFVLYSLEGSPFAEKNLKITIPENLDYYEVFDDVFLKFTKTARLVRVKTVNMGSLYELEYQIKMKDEKQEKTMIDALRVRNGNLGIVCARTSADQTSL